MKKLSLGILFTLFSLSSFANSYCYDYGVFAVSRYKEAVAACNTSFDLRKFDELVTALIKGNSKRGLKASGALRVALADVSWSPRYTDAERECLKPIVKEKQPETDLEVLRALELCL